MSPLLPSKVRFSEFYKAKFLPEETVNEPKTDDFNEAAAEIVESVIDNATSDTLVRFFATS